ncbi:MAG: two-component system [Proteobacteria bacterium]|nr:two-component system [Pseudomonadota bacterium]
MSLNDLIRLRSLKSRLIVWVFMPIALIVAVDLVGTYHSTEQIATTIQQQLLHGSAKMISEQLVFSDGGYEISVPPAAFELFENKFQDHVYFSVRSKDGKLIAGDDELAAYEESLPIEEERYFVARLHGEVVRVIVFAHALPDSSTGDYAITQVAQTLLSHENFREGLFFSAIGRHLLLLAITIASLVISLKWTLSPLKEFSRELLQRQSGSLEKLDGYNAPSELDPVIRALNEYVERLNRTLSSYEKFVANTAHHLRTSFAIIASQINFAKRAKVHDQVQREVLDAIQKTLGDCTKVINQLLVLASIEQQDAASADDVQISEIIMAVIDEMAPLAYQKHIELGIDVFDDSVRVAAPARLLHELIANLIDNAIVHMGKAGEVVISLRRQTDHVLLSVTDDGVGIPPALQQKVLERFFRIDESRAGSSGLGLAIVKEICDRLKAQLSLHTPASGAGLQVDIRFPLSVKAN